MNTDPFSQKCHVYQLAGMSTHYKLIIVAGEAL